MTRAKRTGEAITNCDLSREKVLTLSAKNS